MRYVYARLGGAVLAGAVLAVVLVLGVLLPKCEGPGPHPFTHAAVMAAVSTCPPGTNCLPNPVLITDNAPGMGAPFLIEDNEGLPPGQNAVMFWVDGFQAGSVNPVCAAAVSPYLAREACLGGPPFDATGGHPVVSLWDGRRWQTLTAGDITWLHRAERLRPSW